MPGAPEIPPAAVPKGRTDDHDPPLAGGQSDLDLWGDWPDDELEAPRPPRSDRPSRLTGADAGTVSSA